jgi:hypothetical protein
VSSAARALAQMFGALPGDLPVRITVEPGQGPYTVDEVRAALKGDHPRVITTGKAAALFGWSADTWARWATAGEVEGAKRDGARWRLPYEACEAQYRRRMSGAPTGERKRRGRPRKEKTAPAPTSRLGAARLPGARIALVEDRSAPLGTRAHDAQGPRGSRLAGPRRPNRIPGNG